MGGSSEGDVCPAALSLGRLGQPGPAAPAMGTAPGFGDRRAGAERAEKLTEWIIGPMKRFWTKTEIAADGDNFIVRLDERPVKLPSGKPLAVPFRALAEGIAAEWAAVGPEFYAG